MPLDFFLHVPKCGGSSIRTLVAQNYAPERTIGFSGDWNAIIWFRCLDTETKLKYSIAHGHFPWNMHVGMDDGYRYFTFLRDPVDRHFSDFFYQRRWPDSPLHNSIVEGDLSLADWASIFDTSPRLRNYLVRYVVDDLFSDAVPESYAPFAFERIRTEFAAFGLVEHFTVSVLLVARALGWRHVLFQKRNVSADKDVVEPALRARAAEAISIDQLFYQRCVALFEERVHQGGSLLADAAQELDKLVDSEATSELAHQRFVVGEDQLALPASVIQRASHAAALRQWLNF